MGYRWLLNFRFILFILWLSGTQLVYSKNISDSSIKIVAYGPAANSETIPQKAISKRVGFNDDILRYIPRPIKQSQTTYNKQRFRQSQPKRKIVSTNSKRRIDLDLSSQNSDEVLVVGQGDLQNPLGPPVQLNTGIGLPLNYSPRTPIQSPFPPSPPVQIVGPPSPPLPPSPVESQSQVTGIKCLDFGVPQTFEAILTLPNGYDSIPVFEDRPSINPTADPTCRMIPTQLAGMYQLLVSNYDLCGVRKCIQSNGETWNCLVLRFPRISGLKLPEDELIEIRCRPHDRTADDVHVLAVATSNFANKLPVVFEGLQEFECEIGLFRQLPGTQQFNTRVGEDGPLELGEKVQLWSIIKDGDGWEYSRLSEVVIQKGDQNSERNSQNTVVLVFSDGCRNPKYKIIAEDHPFRDSTNKLVNKFTFRTFMFQDMLPGDSLYITAKVVGCIMEEDCKPTTCPDDGNFGYGKRRKRNAVNETKEFEFTTKMPLPPTTDNTGEGSPKASPLISHIHRRHGNVTDWSRNLAIKIRMPDETIKQKTLEIKDCKLYLFISLGVSVFVCILAVCLISCAFCRRKKTKKVDSFNIPPSSSATKKHKKKSLASMQSLSGSETCYSGSETSSNNSDLQKIAVPPTVKEKKKEVNAELMGLFGDENLIPYNGNYPHSLLNYYGYMVVPRPQGNCQKPTVKAMKRSSRARSCSCNEEGSLSDDPDFSKNHKSVIKISSTGSETITVGSSQTKPKPRPRLLRGDPIYSEIHENTRPTLV